MSWNACRAWRALTDCNAILGDGLLYCWLLTFVLLLPQINGLCNSGTVAAQPTHSKRQADSRRNKSRKLQKLPNLVSTEEPPCFNTLPGGWRARLLFFFTLSHFLSVAPSWRSLFVVQVWCFVWVCRCLPVCVTDLLCIQWVRYVVVVLQNSWSLLCRERKMFINKKSNIEIDARYCAALCSDG